MTIALDQLELRREPGGFRHYLDGQPIHAGDLLEMQTDDGSWVLIRYEWNQKQNKSASLVLNDDFTIELTASTHLRWPDGGT